MLNFNDEYSMPGYYYRIKEFLEDDDAAKERNKKLKGKYQLPIHKL